MHPHGCVHPSGHDNSGFRVSQPFEFEVSSLSLEFYSPSGQDFFRSSAQEDITSDTSNDDTTDSEESEYSGLEDEGSDSDGELSDDEDEVNASRGCFIITNT